MPFTINWLSQKLGSVWIDWGAISYSSSTEIIPSSQFQKSFFNVVLWHLLENFCSVQWQLKYCVQWEVEIDHSQRLTYRKKEQWLCMLIWFLFLAHSTCISHYLLYSLMINKLFGCFFFFFFWLGTTFNKSKGLELNNYKENSSWSRRSWAPQGFLFLCGLVSNKMRVRFWRRTWWW